MEFTTFFKRATGKEPFPYQIAFAEAEALTELISVATGTGKTATVVLGSIFRRRFHRNKSIRAATPRRLIYCLPMRTLVEQTATAAESWLRNLKLADDVKVHVLMGGVDGDGWDRSPENDAIVIGTQDMLISRALNRGYGMSRYRWPIHFSLLNNDCLWVMDETQLMGVGLTTTAQLQGLRSKLETFGITHSLWMSATLDSSPINTVDHAEPSGGFSKIELTGADRKHSIVKQRLGAKKTLEKSKIALSADTEKKTYSKELAAAIQAAHQPHTLTLVVLNRVSRAQDVFAELEKLAKKCDVPAELGLVHARFRPKDRKRYEDALLSGAVTPGGRIVVATQAIEAGVDVSAATFFTELAPWPSLVQRFGRCNRYGEVKEARVIWIDVQLKDDKDKLRLPYEADEFARSRRSLTKLENVGPLTLQEIEDERSLPIMHTLRRKDLLDLWDTTPDLAGNDLDVSRFIRDADDTDVQVYWRDVDDDAKREALPAPERHELCSVSLPRAREFLDKLAKKSQYAWMWNALERIWRELAPSEIRPGMMLLLRPEMGGYLSSIGWTGDPNDKPMAYPPPEMNEKDEGIDDNPETTCGHWLSISQHLDDVTNAVHGMRDTMKEYEKLIPWSEIGIAARWHDVGKAHPAFQNMLLRNRNDAETRRTILWAKSDSARNGRPRYFAGENGDEERVGFRHELASALAWLYHNGTASNADLVAFLIAAHHGKVRMSIRSLPNENRPGDESRRFARGVWDGDILGPLDLGDGISIPATTLDLGYMELGERAKPESVGPVNSWLARVIGLRDEYGPFRLSFLEMLLRIADWRGSAIGERL